MFDSLCVFHFLNRAQIFKVFFFLKFSSFDTDLTASWYYMRQSWYLMYKNICIGQI